MSEHAKVSSLEAIENFRARLIVYREKASRVLDEVNDDVIRARQFIEVESPSRWQGELKRLHRELEQRQQELFSAQISNLAEASAVQQMAVQKARRAIREAEAKLDMVKHWRRQFDHRVEPLGRQAEKLRHTLGHDLGMATVWLAELIKTISAYAEISPSPRSPAPAPTGSDETSGPTSTAPEAKS